MCSLPVLRKRPTFARCARQGAPSSLLQLGNLPVLTEQWHNSMTMAMVSMEVNKSIQSSSMGVSRFYHVLSNVLFSFFWWCLYSRPMVVSEIVHVWFSVRTVIGFRALKQILQQVGQNRTFQHQRPGRRWKKQLEKWEKKKHPGMF